jgi:hypothetical protein
VGVVALEAGLGFDLPTFIISVGENTVITHMITRDKGARHLATLTVGADIAALSADAVDFKAGTCLAWDDVGT